MGDLFYLIGRTSERGLGIFKNKALAGDFMQKFKREKGDPAIYRLQKMTGDPRFEGFGFVREKSLTGGDDISDDFMLASTDIPGQYVSRSLKGLWKPQRITGRVRDFNDYPCANLSIPVFSGRAIKSLGEMLNQNGELLALDSKLFSEYMAYNVTNVQDILDLNKSKMEWISGEIFIDVNHYVLKKNAKIDGLSIFKMPHSRSGVYVTQDFVDSVRIAGLQGFNFTKVWPFARGVSWRKIDSDRRKQMREAAKSITAESLIVGIDLLKGVKQVQAAKKKKINQWMDAVDNLLMKAEKEETYYGTLVGHEFKEAKEGWRCVFFFSCPDASKLAKRLQGKILELKGEFEVIVHKRMGTIHDADAKETLLKIV